MPCMHRKKTWRNACQNNGSTMCVLLLFFFLSGFFPPLYDERIMTYIEIEKINKNFNKNWVTLIWPINTSIFFSLPDLCFSYFAPIPLKEKKEELAEPALPSSPSGKHSGLNHIVDLGTAGLPETPQFFPWNPENISSLFSQGWTQHWWREDQGWSWFVPEGVYFRHTATPVPGHITMLYFTDQQSKQKMVFCVLQINAQFTTAMRDRSAASHSLHLHVPLRCFLRSFLIRLFLILIIHYMASSLYTLKGLILIKLLIGWHY